MFRKALLAMVMVMGLVLSASLAIAQAPAAGTIPPEALAALQKEKPLAQADVDSYVKIMPQMAKVMSDPAAIAKLYEGAGLSEVRFSLISAKIGLGMALASGATAEQINLNQIPEVLRPSATEIDLVKKNLDKLQKAAMEMAAAMQQQQ